MLLHSGGEDLLDIFESFSLNAKDKTDLSVVLKQHLLLTLLFIVF